MQRCCRSWPPVFLPCFFFRISAQTLWDIHTEYLNVPCVLLYFLLGSPLLSSVMRPPNDHNHSGEVLFTGIFDSPLLPPGVLMPESANRTAAQTGEFRRPKALCQQLEERQKNDAGQAGEAGKQGAGHRESLAGSQRGQHVVKPRPGHALE